MGMSFCFFVVCVSFVVEEGIEHRREDGIDRQARRSPRVAKQRGL
jgi:hypothetical protein